MLNESISLIVPIYNEKDSIECSIEEIHVFLKKNFKDFEIILIESGSTDGSDKIVDRIRIKYNSIIVFHEKTRNGFGSAMKIGIKLAGKELISMITVDRPFELKYILEAVKASRENDFVLSYRVNDRRSMIRRIQSFFYNCLINLFLGLKVKHVNSALKLYKNQSIKRVNIQSNTWFFDAEVIYRLINEGFKFKEIPVPILDRKTGKSTVSNTTAFGIFKELIIFWYSEKWQKRSQ